MESLRISKVVQVVLASLDSDLVPVCACRLGGRIAYLGTTVSVCISVREKAVNPALTLKPDNSFLTWVALALFELLPHWRSSE